MCEENTPGLKLELGLWLGQVRGHTSGEHTGQQQAVRGSQEQPRKSGQGSQEPSRAATKKQTLLAIDWKRAACHAASESVRLPS